MQAAVLEAADLRTKLQQAESLALKASQELAQAKQQLQQATSGGSLAHSASAGSITGADHRNGGSGGAGLRRRPTRALRRVEDGEGGSWLLFEFEGGAGVREWRRFADEVRGWAFRSRSR
jgi:hypothetical protein